MARPTLIFPVCPEAEGGREGEREVRAGLSGKEGKSQWHVITLGDRGAHLTSD